MSKIRLLNSPSNDISLITYFQLFHGQLGDTIFELRAFTHDHFVSIWVKEPPLDSAGTWCRPVYPYNWQLRLWRQVKQLGTELTTCPLSKVIIHLQLSRKYINI